MKIKTLFAALAALMLASCSHEKADTTDYLSASDIVCINLHPATIIENSAGNVDHGTVTLSPSSEKLLSSMLGSKHYSQLQKILAVKGFDPSTVSIGMDINSEVLRVIVAVDNKKDAIAYLHEVDPDLETIGSELGFDILVDDETAVFVGKSIAFVASVGSNADYKALLSQLIDTPNQMPLQGWQRETIAKGNLMGMIINIGQMLDLYQSNNRFGDMPDADVLGVDPDVLKSSSMLVNFELEGCKLSAKTQLKDTNGNLVKSAWSNQKVDPSMLKYVSENDMAVVMMAVSGDYNWKKAFDAYIAAAGGYRRLGISGEMIAYLENVLSCIDGTFLMAFGPESLLALRSADAMHFVIAAQCKPGCEKVLADLPIGLPIYTATFGNVFVVSNKNIVTDQKTLFSKSDFKNASSAFNVRIPKQNVFSSFIKLPFGVDFSCVSDGATGVLTIEETDTDGLFLANIIELVAGNI